MAIYIRRRKDEEDFPRIRVASQPANQPTINIASQPRVQPTISRVVGGAPTREIRQPQFQTPSIVRGLSGFAKSFLEPIANIGTSRFNPFARELGTTAPEAREQAQRKVKELTPGADTPAGQFGRFTGEAIQIAAPGVGAYKGILSAPRVARLATKPGLQGAITRGGAAVVSGIPPSAVSYGQARQRGEPTNLAKEIGIGVGIDVATLGAGRIIRGARGLRNPASQGVRQGVGELAERGARSFDEVADDALRVVRGEQPQAPFRNQFDEAVDRITREVPELGQPAVRTSAAREVDDIATRVGRVMQSTPRTFDEVVELSRGFDDPNQFKALLEPQLRANPDLAVQLEQDLQSKGLRNIQEAFDAAKRQEGAEELVQPRAETEQVTTPLEDVAVRADEGAPRAVTEAESLTGSRVPEPLQSPVEEALGQRPIRVTETPSQIPETARVSPQDVSAEMTLRGQPPELERANVLRRAESQVNPFAPASRIDYEVARVLGVSPNQLPASQRLEHSLDVSLSGKAPRVYQKAGDFGVDRVVQKYGYNTPAEGELFNYMKARFAIQLRKVKGTDIYPGISDKELSGFIRQYEQTNPSAIQDAKAVRDWMYDYLTRGERAGAFEKGTAKAVKDRYGDNYVPIERLFPEELERVSINASPVGTIGRQSILRNIEGSSLPISSNFDTLYKRAASAENQIDRANAFNLLYGRAEQGIKGAGKVVQSPEQMRTLRGLRETFGELGNLRDQLQREGTKVRGKARVVNTQVRQATKELSNKVRGLLRKSIDDVDARSAINDLTPDDMAEIAYSALPSGGTWRNAQTFSKRSAAHQKLVNQIEDIRNTVQGLSAARGDISQEVISVRPDSFTGRQVVTGLREGLPAKIEVSPELARMLQGLDQQKSNALVETIRLAQRPFREAFTGALNPIFSGMSFALYDAPIGVINSPQGWRTLLSPRAWGKMFESFHSNNSFQRKLREGGAQVVTGSLAPVDIGASAKYVAAQKNLFTKTKYALNPRNIKDVIERLDVLGGKLQNATRTRIAKVAYDDAIRKSFNEQDAIANAVYAYNNIMPNYKRASKLVRDIDAILPYTSASIAGTRAAGVAVRRASTKTLAKAALFISPVIGATAYNMSHQKGKEFYADMERAGKHWIYDNNIVVVLPNASKDPETGEWDGVIKIPVAPELRAMNKLTGKQTRDQINGNGLTDPETYASALFDTTTGQVFNPESTSSPAIETIAGLATNQNTKYGSDIVPDELRDLPEEEQVFGSTTDIAKSIAKTLGTSPLKVQFVINQFGAGGRLVSNPTSIVEETKKRFTGAKGLSAGAEFYQDREQIFKDLGFNQNDKAAYTSLHPKKETALGRELYNADAVYNSAAKLDIYNRFPKVFEADRRLDQRNRNEGRPGNPLFDLPEWQRKKVLEKANLPPGADDPELSNLWGQEWYQDYNNKRSAFYSQAKALAATEGRPWKEGDNPYPETPPELQRVMEHYSSLPKGTGDRSAWIRSNPQLWQAMTSQWAAIDNWQNIQRGKRGLAATEGEAGIAGGFKEPFGQTGGRGGGRGRGARVSSASVKAVKGSEKFKTTAPPKITIAKTGKKKKISASEDVRKKATIRVSKKNRPSGRL